MKRILSFLTCLILCLCFLGCSKTKETASAEDVSSMIASEIESLEGSQNFEEETIKTLAEFYRSNYSKDQAYFKMKEKHKNDYIYNIVKKESFNPALIKSDNVFVFDEQNEWNKEIGKIDILKFLSKKDVSLVSIKKAEPVFENKKVVGIKIGKKIIGIDEIVEAFDLPSKNVTSMENKKTKIKVFGKFEEAAVKISPETINNMAKSGKNRVEILESLNNDFYLITKNK